MRNASELANTFPSFPSPPLPPSPQFENIGKPSFKLSLTSVNANAILHNKATAAKLSLQVTALIELPRQLESCQDLRLRGAEHRQ